MDDIIIQHIKKEIIKDLNLTNINKNIIHNFIDNYDFDNREIDNYILLNPSIHLLFYIINNYNLKSKNNINIINDKKLMKFFI